MPKVRRSKYSLKRKSLKRKSLKRKSKNNRRTVSKSKKRKYNKKGGFVRSGSYPVNPTREVSPGPK